MKKVGLATILAIAFVVIIWLLLFNILGWVIKATWLFAL